MFKSEQSGTSSHCQDAEHNNCGETATLITAPYESGPESGPVMTD